MMKILKQKETFCLVAFILLAFILRFYGLNWDEGFHLHPDERMLVMVTERISLPKLSDWELVFTSQSPLNPQFFAYGSLPIYLLKLFSWLMAFLLGSKWMSYAYLQLVGRVLVIFFDLGSILMIYKIGNKIWGKKVGLGGAFFYSTCVLPIQLAHFFTVDIPLNFFILFTLYRLLIFYNQPNFKNGLFLGAAFGWALATKVNATLLIFSIGTALFVDLLLVFLKFIRATQKSWSTKLKLLLFKGLRKLFWQEYLFRTLSYFLIIMMTTFIIYLFAQPYTLIDFQTFWRQIKEQHRMVYDPYAFPYTLQFVVTTPYWYQFKNMILWGMGIGLGFLSSVGTGWYLADLVRRILIKGDYDREAKELILVVFWFVYFLVVGRFAVKFMRYFLPLYPIFILMGVRFLTSLNYRFRIWLLSLVIIPHLIWLFSFISIYSRPHSRIEASRWINENIPPRSVLAVEHWDDRLPLWGMEKYQFVEMPMYESDDSSWKWKTVEENLTRADYVILASNRLYTPLMKLGDCQKFPPHRCYPKTVEYYKKLFDDSLGFTKVAEFTSYPQFSILKSQFSIRDEVADESFTVYDHPKIMIFKRTGLAPTFLPIPTSKVDSYFEPARNKVLRQRWRFLLAPWVSLASPRKKAESLLLLPG